jgi:pimeloyl-ACP methyl ester carboxylesterase
MAMREFGDVVAFDQRGTGLSDRVPDCQSSELLPGSTPVSDAEFTQRHREALRECALFWGGEGVDIRGYTTLESVYDLSSLRHHLGAEKLTLWGISYGSHLALAAMKVIPDEIDRVIIASVEGLDQTVKLPSRTDAYLDRLGVHLGIDDIQGLMRDVHESLEEDPVLLELDLGDQGMRPYLLQRRDMQILSSAAVADPTWAARLVQLYREVNAGRYELLTAVLPQFVYPDQPITLRAMPAAMDRASGVSKERLARFQQEAESALLGEYLNFPMPQIMTELPMLDLGSDFRRGPRSDIPTLVLTGTLDGRTYIEGQREATAGLSAAHTVVVDGAGHNLFMASPQVLQTMQMFMAGKPLQRDRILALPTVN